MDLIVLLYELRDGKFTNKDAARRWAQRNPAECRSSGVLPADNTKNGPVDARRLSELMKMTKGPVPRGLVQAFVDLWAEHHQHDRALIDAKAAVLNSLYSAVRQHATQRPSVKGHSRLSKDVGQLQDKIINVQDELNRTRKDEANFRTLSLFLVMVVQSLERQRDDLIGERDALLAGQSTSASMIPDSPSAVAVIQVQQVTTQLDRAHQQAIRTDQEIKRAVALIAKLEQQFHELLTRLDALHTGETSTGVLPPPITDELTLRQHSADDNLEDNQQVLERVDEMIDYGSDSLEITYQNLMGNQQPDVEVDGVIHPPPQRPDNLPSSNNPTTAPDNKPVAKTARSRRKSIAGVFLLTLLLPSMALYLAADKSDTAQHNPQESKLPTTTAESAPSTNPSTSPSSPVRVSGISGVKLSSGYYIKPTSDLPDIIRETSTSTSLSFSWDLGPINRQVHSIFRTSKAPPSFSAKSMDFPPIPIPQSDMVFHLDVDTTCGEVEFVITPPKGEKWRSKVGNYSSINYIKTGSGIADGTEILIDIEIAESSLPSSNCSVKVLWTPSQSL